MSIALTFDTLAYAKQLKAADVPEKQAEAQAEALRSALDTAFTEQAKAQEQVTIHAVDQLDTKTEKALALVHKEIALVRKDMDAGFAATDAKLESLRKDLIIKMGGMFVLAVGIIVTVLFRLLK